VEPGSSTRELSQQPPRWKTSAFVRYGGLSCFVIHQIDTGSMRTS